MIEVIVCTNRVGSNSLKVANLIVEKINKTNKKAQVLELSDIDWSELNPNTYGEDNRPESMKALVERVNKAEGL